MLSKINRTGFASGRLQSSVACAAFALALTISLDAQAATKEIVLASPSQALAFCQSGKMKTYDIDYINGTGGLAQSGPGYNCTQQIPTGTGVGNAILVNGSKVKECKLANAKQAVLFCQDGGMGTYDIAYISGKVDHTISGPGYGCTVGFSTSGIGNALCK